MMAKAIMAGKVEKYRIWGKIEESQKKQTLNLDPYLQSELGSFIKTVVKYNIDTFPHIKIITKITQLIGEQYILKDIFDGNHKELKKYYTVLNICLDTIVQEKHNTKSSWKNIMASYQLLKDKINNNVFLDNLVLKQYKQIFEQLKSVPLRTISENLNQSSPKKRTISSDLYLYSNTSTEAERIIRRSTYGIATDNGFEYGLTDT